MGGPSGEGKKKKKTSTTQYLIRDVVGEKISSVTIAKSRRVQLGKKRRKVLIQKKTYD